MLDLASITNNSAQAVDILDYHYYYYQHSKQKSQSRKTATGNATIRTVTAQWTC